MSNILAIGARAHFLTGDSPTTPLGGGSLYVYAAGTTTPLTIYSDRDSATPIANPVVLDSAGRTPTPVFVAEGVAFKLRLEDSTGILIWENDDQVPAASSIQLNGLDAARQLLGYIPTVDPATPAVGDGVADDTEALTAAINSSAAPVIDLGGKTYRITDEIEITRQSCTIRNGTIDMTDLEGSSEMFAFRAESDLAGSTSITDLSLSRGDSVINVASTAGYAAGDIVFVSAWVRIDGGADVGEIARVREINSGTRLTLTRPLIFGYPAGFNPSVRRYDAPKNIRFENVDFIGSVPANPGHTRGAIRLEHADRCVIDQCDTSGVYSYGVFLDGCLDSSVSRCSFNQMTDPSLGFGVTIENGCYGTRVSDIRGDDCNRLIQENSTTAGFNLRTRVTGSTYTGPGQLIYCGASSVEFFSSGCDGSQSGGSVNDDLIFFGGISGSIEGCQAYGAERNGILFFSLFDNTVSAEIPLTYRVSDCQVLSTAANAIRFDMGPNVTSLPEQLFFDRISVSGCTVDDCAGVAGIWVEMKQYTAVDSINITDCFVDAVAAVGPDDGIRIDSGNTGAINHVSVSGGYYDSLAVGIRLMGTGTNTFEAAHISNVRARGIIGLSVEGAIASSVITAAGCSLVSSANISGRAFRSIGSNHGQIILSACTLRGGQFLYENNSTVELKISSSLLDTEGRGGGVEFTGNVATKTDVRLI